MCINALERAVEIEMTMGAVSQRAHRRSADGVTMSIQSLRPGLASCHFVTMSLCRSSAKTSMSETFIKVFIYQSVEEKLFSLIPW